MSSALSRSPTRIAPAAALLRGELLREQAQDAGHARGRRLRRRRAVAVLARRGRPPERARDDPRRSTLVGSESVRSSSIRRRHQPKPVLAGQLVREPEHLRALGGIGGDERGLRGEPLGEEDDLGPRGARRLVLPKIACGALSWPVQATQLRVRLRRPPVAPACRQSASRRTGPSRPRPTGRARRPRARAAGPEARAPARRRSIRPRASVHAEDQAAGRHAGARGHHHVLPRPSPDSPRCRAPGARPRRCRSCRGCRPRRAGRRGC